MSVVCMYGLPQMTQGRNTACFCQSPTACMLWVSLPLLFFFLLSIKILFYLSRFSAAYFCRWFTSTRSGVNAWVQWKPLNYRSWESGLSLSSFHCAAWANERSTCEPLNMTISFAFKVTQMQKLTVEIQMGKLLLSQWRGESKFFLFSAGLSLWHCKIETH